MDYLPLILTLAQTTPLLPTIVAKELKTNTIMAGAMLSEMCSKGILKTSALRVGGSPLYYIPGREEQLLRYISSLNEKDQRTVERLKTELVIRESEADPLTRVSLSQIKDFAQPLLVQYEQKEEKFWKWFAISEENAKEIIREKISPKQEETQQKTSTEKQLILTEKTDSQTVKQKIEQHKSEKQKKEGQKTNTFFNNVSTFLETNGIKIKEQKILKRTDFDLTLEMPSPVGNLSYYCKAKSKKRVSDADLSAAYVQGQMRKLPIIFITDGELSKSAKAIIGELKGLTVKKVEDGS